MSRKKNDNGKPKKVAVKKSAILWLCLILVVLAVGIFVTGRIAENQRLAAAIANDISEANRIHWETGRRPAGMINGEHFFQEDWEIFRLESRASVANHYFRRFNIQFMGADFWDTVFEDGLTPREFLDEWALRDLTRNIIIIQQARLRGIDTPNTYSDLETERAAWNAPTDDIVFGPRTLGPAEFNSYRIHGIINGLKTVLLQNELRPTPAQLRAAFETLHEDLRTEPFIAQVVRFFWDEGLPNDEIQAVTRSLIEQGFSPEEIEANLSDLYQGFTIAEFEIDSRFGSRESPYEIERKNILWDDGAEGLIFAGPLEEPAIYLVTEFEGGGELRFEDGIHLGRNRWINDQFEVFIDEKIRQARITLFRDEDFTRPLN